MIYPRLVRRAVFIWEFIFPLLLSFTYCTFIYLFIYLFIYFSPLLRYCTMVFRGYYTAA